ncbi:MAG TPA: aquaporin [Planctomycetaceae bacterium]|nr:aquaporin [Planctomycetaceae bacterium]
MLSRRLGAEAFGTFWLVFAGTGAAVVNEVTDGVVTHVGVALAFGLVVMVLIHAVGSVSGCHINPAVTIGLAAAGRFERRDVPSYVASQCVGAVLASATLRLLFPDSVTLGATIPAGGDLQSFVLEFILTFVLMFVVLTISAGDRDERRLGGIVIGSVIALEALFAGPVSGASMNPARSLGPALVSTRLDSLWIYLVAPIVGALASVPVQRWMHGSPGGPSGDRVGRVEGAQDA